MFTGPGKPLRNRLRSLEHHLRLENPLLVAAVRDFRRLDRVGYAMGLLDKNESFVTQIAWWPMISLLGTFSAGKSSFINHYLGMPLQSTGTQAVDDKFTVVCYSRDQQQHDLPGVALDADPRFPFYQISDELEKVAAGEGRRIDAYLQLKSCPSEAARGVILIDSPGFDADEQRTATLRLTNHIIDLSDLVLVMFDARHPEPGAMQDTLKHLVGNTLSRPDSSKFLFVLNQIDSTAREDNPEEVVAAWQRALAKEGLTAGSFFTIYNPDAAVTIEDEAVRQRFESKRDAGLAAIYERMQRVNVERAYRIIGALEQTAHQIEETTVPKLRQLLREWSRKTLRLDMLLIGLLLAALLGGSIWAGNWDGLRFSPPWLDDLLASSSWRLAAAVAGVAALLGIHWLARGFIARRVLNRLEKQGDAAEPVQHERLVRAFRRNIRWDRSVFSPEPAGWHWLSRHRLRKAHEAADRHIQSLNDRFTNPSGLGAKARAVSPDVVKVAAVQKPEIAAVAEATKGNNGQGGNA